MTPHSPRHTPVIRQLAFAQLVTSIGDGAVLATSALYFTTMVGLESGQVAAGLAIGAAAGLVTAVPLGALADRIGLKRGLLLFCLTAIAGLLVFAVAQTPLTYAVASVLYTTGRSNIVAAGQALLAVTLPTRERVRARGILHATLNLGLAAGSGVGALALLLGHRQVFPIIFLADAVLFVAAAVVYRTIPVPEVAVRIRENAWPVLRDLKYLCLTLLAAATQLTMPMLSLVLPLWFVSQAGAPKWLSGVVLLVNTLIIVIIQVPISSRIHTDRTARRALLVAGASILVACLAFGSMGFLSPVAGIVVALVGTVVLTLGETTSTSGGWHFAFNLAPDRDHGQYQAMFGMSTTLARIAGPLAVLPIVTAFGETGWLIVGVLICAASVGLSLMGTNSRRAGASAAPDDGLTPSAVEGAS